MSAAPSPPRRRRRRTGAAAAALACSFSLSSCLLLVLGVGRVGDRRCSTGVPRLDDLVRRPGSGLAILPFGVDGLRRGLAEREVLLAQRLLGVGGGQPDDLRDVDLAGADGDRIADRRALLDLGRPPPGSARSSVPGATLSSSFSFLLGSSLSSALVSFFSAVERRRLADDLGHERRSGAALRSRKNSSSEQQRQQRQQPPRQPRLLAEDALGRHQRRRRAPPPPPRPGSFSLPGLASWDGVELTHLRALDLRRRGTAASARCSPPGPMLTSGG